MTDWFVQFHSNCGPAIVHSTLSVVCVFAASLPSSLPKDLKNNSKRGLSLSHPISPPVASRLPHQISNLQPLPLQRPMHHRNLHPNLLRDVFCDNFRPIHRPPSWFLPRTRGHVNMASIPDWTTDLRHSTLMALMTQIEATAGVLSSPTMNDTRRHLSHKRNVYNELYMG